MLGRWLHIALRNNAMKPIEQLKPADLKTGTVIAVHYGQNDTVERFICTRIGRIAYIVSLNCGYAYTRPQLIEKYGKVAAEFEFTSLL